MARKSLRAIAALIAAAVPGVVSLKVSANGPDKSLRFGGTVTVDGTAYEVAADNGKLKRYAEVDAFVKDAAAHFPTNNGTYTVQVETGLVLVQSLPSDLKKDAAAKVIKLGAKKTTQQGVVTKLDADLLLMAGWENGNALQVARFNEVTTEKATVVNDIAAIDAQIAHYTAIANS